MEGCVGDFSLTGPIESESNTEDQVRGAGDVYSVLCYLWFEPKHAGLDTHAGAPHSSWCQSKQSPTPP